MVQLVKVTEVMTKQGKAGEVRGPARRNDVSSGGGPPPIWLPKKKRHFAASEREILSSTTTSSHAGVVFRWLERRTARSIVT